MNDNRTVRRVALLGCAVGRHLARRYHVASAYAVGVTLALAVVSPAAAEWDTVADRNLLSAVEFNTRQTEANTWLMSGTINIIEQRIANIETDADAIRVVNEDNLPFLEDIYNTLILIEENTQVEQTPIEGTLPYGDVPQTPWTPAAWNLPVVSDTIELDTAVLSDGTITFDDPEDPAPEAEPEVTWSPPTRNGKNVFDVDINLGPLGSLLGSSAGTISIGTDLGWYDGAPRNAVHAAMVAFVTICCAWLLFQEFKRMA